MRKTNLLLVIWTGFLAGPASALPVHAAQSPLVAAASSLRPALEAISARFTDKTGRRVRFSYASSGVLSTQILRGAPYELFLSADESYVDRLFAGGAVRDRGVVYASGRLVVFVTNGELFDVSRGIAAFAQAIADRRINRLAIAHPEHAPYGRAARALLTNLEVWQQLDKQRLVIGENAAQAARFATTGAVDAALLPLSLVTEPALAARGKYMVVSERWLRPLRQRMVVLPGAGAAAREFFDLLRSDVAAEIWRRHGFEPTLRDP